MYVFLSFENKWQNFITPTQKPFQAHTCIRCYLFVVPLMVKSDMFFLFHDPVLYLNQDVLKQEEPSYTRHYVYRLQKNMQKHITLTYSGLSFLSPPLMAVFSSLSMTGPSISSSFSRSSSWMISMSLTGSTLPSTWIISSSSNAPEVNR